MEWIFGGIGKLTSAAVKGDANGGIVLCVSEFVLLEENRVFQWLGGSV